MIQQHINAYLWVLTYCLLFSLGGCASPLYRAAAENDAQLLQKAISEGADINHSAPLPLIVAAQKGHHDIIRLLLDAGANPNLTDNKNQTALYIATVNQHEQVVEILLKGGASPNIHTADGSAPLLEAVYKQNKQLVEMLLSSGADPNLTNKHGVSALLFAAEGNNIGILTSLIDHGAKLDHKSKLGIDPLFSAVVANNLKATKIILEKGASPNTHTADGRFPLIVATFLNNAKMVKALISSDADVNMTNNYGATSLIVAADKGYIDIVKLLLKNGADPTLVQSNGVDALNAATSRNFLTIATLIESSILPKAKTPSGSTPKKPVYPKNEYTIYTGTGWLTESGYIVTNHHVIDGQLEIKVRFNSIGPETYEAKIALSDEYNDLAILRLEKFGSINVRGITIAKKMPKIGEDVFTIGYPKTSVMGKNPKVTNGIVSSLSGLRDDPRIIQTTVAIQSGNSGGPLLNMKGEAVGVTTSTLRALVSEGGVEIPQNVNYAVKSAYVLALLLSLPEKETYPMVVLTSSRLEVIVPKIQDSIVQIIVRTIN